MITGWEDLTKRCNEIIAQHFPGGHVVERRMDPDEPGWFVVIDDPANKFEFEQIYVYLDGSWE